MNTLRICLVFSAIVLFGCGEDKNEELLAPFFLDRGGEECEGDVEPDFIFGVPETCRSTFFLEEFSDNSKGWDLLSSSNYSMEINSGNLILSTGPNTGGVPFAFNRVIGLETLDQFEIQFKFRVRDFGSNPSNSLITWGGEDLEFENYHELLFLIGGYYLIRHIENDVEAVLFEGEFEPDFVNEDAFFRHRRYDGIDYYFFNEELVFQEEARPLAGSYVTFGAGLDVEVWIDAFQVIEVF